MIFVDTGAWFANIVPDDLNHTAATELFDRNADELLITTDYVVDETLTLLKARGQGACAAILGQQFFDGEIAIVHHLTEEDLYAAWQIFYRFSDKEWSFTDCTSKVIMEKLGLTYAFAFDHHFRQFGSIIVLPEEKR